MDGGGGETGEREGSQQAPPESLRERQGCSISPVQTEGNNRESRPSVRSGQSLAPHSRDEQPAKAPPLWQQLNSDSAPGFRDHPGANQTGSRTFNLNAERISLCLCLLK